MKNKVSPSPETQQEALKIAKATQKPGQTKEQTKLIAQGIEKGIAQYKKQQKEKARQADKAKKKARKVKQTQLEVEFTHHTTRYAARDFSLDCEPLKVSFYPLDPTCCELARLHFLCSKALIVKRQCAYHPFANYALNPKLVSISVRLSDTHW